MFWCQNSGHCTCLRGSGVLDLANVGHDNSWHTNATETEIFVTLSHCIVLYTQMFHQAVNFKGSSEECLAVSAKLFAAPFSCSALHSCATAQRTPQSKKGCRASPENCFTDQTCKEWVTEFPIRTSKYMDSIGFNWIHRMILSDPLLKSTSSDSSAHRRNAKMAWKHCARIPRLQTEAMILHQFLERHWHWHLRHPAASCGILSQQHPAAPACGCRV